jgi:hypothetical protein
VRTEPEPRRCIKVCYPDPVDWQGPDGRYCENDAAWIRTSTGSGDDPRNLCESHRPRTILAD